MRLADDKAICGASRIPSDILHSREEAWKGRIDLTSYVVSGMQVFLPLWGSFEDR